MNISNEIKIAIQGEYYIYKSSDRRLKSSWSTQDGVQAHYPQIHESLASMI